MDHNTQRKLNAALWTGKKRVLFEMPSYSKTANDCPACAAASCNTSPPNMNERLRLGSDEDRANDCNWVNYPMLGIGGSPLGASADGSISVGVSGGAVARISLGAQRRKFSSSRIDAAFTPREHRSPAQAARLAESDQLVAELLAADLLVIGAPMYNFGLPSQLKAWIDNIVRVGVTFGFDRSRDGEPYWPMLPRGKRLVILSARGDYGYDPGGRLAAMNLVESSLQVPLDYVGLTDSHAIAIEYDEFADERLAASIATAEQATDELVNELASTYS